MNSAERVPLNWKRPPEWDRFLSSIERIHSATALYAGFEIERAWREYREEHPAEEYVDRLMGAVGRRDQDTREKTPASQEASDGGQRVSVRIRKGVKEDMAAYAAKTGSAKHDVLRAVVCWHLSGGLLGRLTDKLEVAVPEAETQLAELDPRDDRGRTAVEKKRDWLATWVKKNRPGGFNADDFGTALEEQPWGGNDSEHMRGKHLQPVLDRLEFTDHPTAGDVYIPEEKAEEIAEEQGIDTNAPAFERRPYGDLTDDERVHGLRVELARQAARGGGKRALRANTVRGEVFDGTPGTRKVKDLMDRAARAEGFETDAKGGTKRLRCDLEAVADRDVRADAGLIADTCPGEAGETDATPWVEADDTGGNDHRTDATAEMERIMAATPATGDGGDAE